VKPLRLLRLLPFLPLLPWVAGLFLHPLAAHATPAQEAEQALQTAGATGGLVLQLGLDDPAFTTALRKNASYQVQALDTRADKVASVRAALVEAGQNGPIATEVYDGKLLPYIDNFINLVVARDLQGTPMAEVLRVLIPGGTAVVWKDGTWTKTVKPLNAGVDDWTHYYYNARGNAVSKDQEVGPPERLQWVGSPRWSRHHDRMSSVSAQVSAKGRLFYIMDEGSRISILLPPKWMLVARDGFNGTVLWKRPIQNWSNHMWPLKTGPTQLTRRLVAEGDRVYVANELEGPLQCLDAATGEVVQSYPETKGTEEILLERGTLYLLVNTGSWSLNEYAPKQQQDQGRVASEYEWDHSPRQLMAVDAGSGKTLWKQNVTCAPITLGTDGKRVVFFNGEGISCLDAATGAAQWTSKPQGVRKKMAFHFGPRVLLHGDMVLYAGGDGIQRGLELKTGEQKWEGSHEKSGYQSPEDLIVAGGLVWNAGTTNGGQSGEFTGRNPLTGEVVKSFAPDVPKGTYWFHHRCYIAKATEKFIIPSRTGIEYVDLDKQHWDLNHWVRGACLYGVMPANGLTYAGPHNCACYPEAKLDGMNALASGSRSPHPTPKPDAERLQKGPAFSQPLTESDADATDWPTYRHDAARSGFSDQPLSDSLAPAWETALSGPLSAPVIADGKVFIAQVDAHTLHALDHASGRKLWHYTAGARIDSPPTFWKGRVFFGGKDGWIYCLRAADGALVWRFQAAPNDRRHAAWEQVESVWPVHGSVLVENETVNAVAGRSVFLDGGLRFVRLDARTGKKLAEMVYDDKDPETGEDFQNRHKSLQMPVGLNDILSSDGSHLYLRSQKITASGERIEIGPVSGSFTAQAGAQQGEGRHLFAPMGFLDDSWFHRSYWVYGKNFAGGHGGYFQAGRFTPEGRILVHDKDNVYGFARESKYYRWTTTMEHQLFAASKDAPTVDPQALAEAKPGPKGPAKNAPGNRPQQSPHVLFPSETLLVGKTPLTVEMWILPDGPQGTLAQQGGGRMGYQLALESGRPGFSVRTAASVATAEAQRPLDPGWHHVAGVLTEKSVRLFIDGELAAEVASPGLIPEQPRLPLQLGSAHDSFVAPFGKGAPYTGLLDQFALFKRALSEKEILAHAQSADLKEVASQKDSGTLLVSSFDNGNARDDSGNKAHGVLNGVETGKGKVAAALWFRKGGPTGSGKSPLAASLPDANAAAPAKGAPKNSFVQHKWSHPVPIFLRAMAMGGKKVFISGPPDMVDEEYAFEKMAKKDPSVLEELREQDEALDGKRGASLWGVSTENGTMGSEIKLPSPPVWDGMAVARGRLYVATVDGKVICFGGKP
jgi:outer membrane protein assembly factor BamB